MCTSVRGPESPRLLRWEAPRKRGSGGSKDARETIAFSTRFRIAAWNCAGLSNLTMTICKEVEFDILGSTVLKHTDGKGIPRRSTQSYLRRGTKKS